MLSDVTIATKKKEGRKKENNARTAIRLSIRMTSTNQRGSKNHSNFYNFTPTLSRKEEIAKYF